MGLQGLDWQTLQVPLAAGLHTKDDPRALAPPGLSICRDVEFDDIGGLRLRKPYTALGYNIVGGSTSLTDVRTIAANGSELLCFTKDSLYSWQAASPSGWLLRGSHLAVNVAEQTRFATTGDQIDSDRAELNGVVFYAWIENSTTRLYVAAYDKATGATIVAPTGQFAGAAFHRPRLVALQTKVLLFHQHADFELFVSALDPADPAGSIAAIPSHANVFGAAQAANYDACAIGSTDSALVAMQHTGSGSYDIATVTSSLAIVTANKARACSGPIAVSVSDNGISAQIVRTSGTNIVGDLINVAGLTDSVINQAIGSGSSPICQIAAAHQHTINGAGYRCYVFWSSAEDATNSAAFAVKSNWVDTGGGLGVQGTFVPWVGVASRAFGYDGRVYVWLAFGQSSGLGSGSANVSATGQFQNAYYLYRDDGLLCAKAVYNRGGGLRPTTGYLPGVQLTSGTTTFSWSATERRIIPLGGGTTTGATRPNAGYAMRAPRDVVFTFDSNTARRCARIGNTLYIASGEILTYDGVQLLECGFHVYPFYFDALKQAPGSIADGTYGYKSTFRSNNAQGELDRSTTATVANATMTAGPSGFVIETVPLPITHKTASAPAVEVWRTAVNPTNESPFYLVTSLNPATTSNPNRYLASDSTLVGFEPVFNDREADTTATVNQTNPENGAILSNLCPPGASIIIASADRLFLAGIAGDPNRVWYSKLRNDGEVAAFNDGLAVAVPPAGGDITGLALLNETLVVFRQRAIYTLPGDGYDNAGGGANYGPARIVSSDVGAVNHESIALTPSGLIFKSNKGWYLLDRGWGVSYIGAGVAKFDSDAIYAVHVIESQHQIRCVTSARLLVYDYLVKEWSEWTIGNALSACTWGGSYVLLSSTATLPPALSGGLPPPPPPANDGTGGNIALGPCIEAPDFSGGVEYGIDVETAWIKLNDLQGYGRVRYIHTLGEFRDTHHLRMRVGRDYQGDGAGGWAYIDDFYWPPAPGATVGGALQMRHAPSKGQCQAIKIRLTASSVNDDGAPPITEALKLTGIGLEVGIKRGLFKRLPATQKT